MRIDFALWSLKGQDHQVIKDGIYIMAYLCHTSIGEPILLWIERSCDICFFQKNKHVQKKVEQTKNVCSKASLRLEQVGSDSLCLCENNKKGNKCALAVETVATLEVCQMRAVCRLPPGRGEGLIVCLWNIINADHGNLLTERGLSSSLPPQISGVWVFFPLIFSLSSWDYNETFPGTQLLVTLWTYNTGEKQHWLNFHNG